MLKNCTSLEQLNLMGNSKFDVSGKISEIEGLKGLNNLKSISFGDFNFFALEHENLMIGSGSKKESETNNENLRVNEQNISVVDNIIRYKGTAFNWVVYHENDKGWGKSQRSKIVLYEYEVVNGFKNGVYKEFYISIGKELAISLDMKQDTIQKLIRKHKILACSTKMIMS